MSFQLVARSAIQPSPLNPRKSFDEAKLQELAASMGDGVGIIEPLVVRANGAPGTFELVAGERRWRAAAIAGLDELPVIVKSLSDAQVIEQMLIENGQREDINPLEEGGGYKQALAIGAFDGVDALAHHVGKSRRYVYDILKLVDDLVPPAKQLLDAGRISASHAVLLSRLNPDQQRQTLDPIAGGLFDNETVLRTPDDEDALEDEFADPARVPAARRHELDEDGIFVGDLKPRSVRELEGYIARHFRFDPKARLSNELFPDTVQAVHAARKVVQITYEYVVHPDAKVDDKTRVYTQRAWKRADGKRGSLACDKSATGVIVVGAARGQAFDVCVNKACDVHWKEERLERERQAKRGAAAGSSASTKAAGEPIWKTQERERHGRGAVWVKALPALLAATVAAVKKAVPKVLFEIASDMAADRWEVGEKEFAAAAKYLPAKADADTLLRTLALGCAIYDLNDDAGGYHGQPRFADVAKVLGVDWKTALGAVQTSASKAKKPAAAAKAKKAAPAAKAKKKTPAATAVAKTKTPAKAVATKKAGKKKAA